MYNTQLTSERSLTYSNETPQNMNICSYRDLKPDFSFHLLLDLDYSIVSEYFRLVSFEIWAEIFYVCEMLSQ